jgi:hypothetical protein
MWCQFFWDVTLSHWYFVADVQKPLRCAATSAIKYPVTQRHIKEELTPLLLFRSECFVY